MYLIETPIGDLLTNNDFEKWIRSILNHIGNDGYQRHSDIKSLRFFPECEGLTIIINGKQIGGRYKLSSF